jgi:hypothetical protein
MLYSKTVVLRRFLLVLLGLILFLNPCRFWGQDVELLVSPGKLSKVHSHLSGVNNCKKCHTDGKQTDVSKCLDCHKELTTRINAGKGYHRDKKGNCVTCHPEHHGEEFQLIELETKNFDHSETGHILQGFHKPITDCRRCHHKATMVPGKKFFSFLLANTDCVSCHKDVHQGQLGVRCEKCHSVDQRFKEIKSSFNHNDSSFPLKGAHRQVNCEKCHRQKKWKNISFARCTDCHQDKHQPSFNKRCSSCHNETSWNSVAAFDHNQTGYPLRGKHRRVTCRQCHPKGSKYRKLPFANCSDCHHRDPHKGQFKQDCRACHVVQGFKKSTYDHQAGTYPLTGKHRFLACKKCHLTHPNNRTVVYKPLGTACINCHKDTHLGQFEKKCSACHVTAGFKLKYLTFNHQADSSYPLLGKHTKVTCQKCHVKKTDQFPIGSGETVRYKPINRDCITCHSDYHEGQLSNRCQQCHNFDSFKRIADFDHQKTRFPLDSLHHQIICAKCHPRVQVTRAGKTVESIKFKPIDTKCMACHKDFDHAKTAFVLTGQHMHTTCQRCHNAKTPNTGKTRKSRNGSFQCRHCHISPHPGNQPICTDCHTTKSWRVDSW